MISTDNISIQFGTEPLFENITVSFSGNNRYGLIGANGSGKSTFLKILTNELDANSGAVSIDKTKRLAKLNQDQFAYEDVLVSDCVIMGHELLWDIKQERDRIYGLSSMTEEQGMRVADLEVDGGINVNTVIEIVEAGANAFVAGSAIFNTSNSVGENVKSLREKIARF